MKLTGNISVKFLGWVLCFVLRSTFEDLLRGSIRPFKGEVVPVDI
jgi:hypothetical protein